MSAASIRIRMYRVGFGDCFLLSLPVAGGMEHILVDCGVHTRGDIGIIKEAVKDIAEETGKKLAVVIATHAHQDHISGFAACAPLFRQFQVREVWMPWTENPKDPAAAALKQKHLALTQLVMQHLAVQPPSKATKAAVDAALQNLTGNEAALQLLKSGINGGVVKYLEAGKQIENVAGIADLSVRILGPPRDPKFLAKMDPPSDQKFLRATAGGGVESVNGVTPFPKHWTVDAKSNPYYAAIDEREKNLLAVAATDAEGLAFALDHMMNNTSVVALFTYRGQQMLFPGDAQYGSWESWIDQPDAGGLLGGLSFYKVAHHGSFNATPKSALARMPEKEFAAMVSTQSEPWPSIPLPALVEALAKRARAVLRSDSIAVKGAPKGPALVKIPKGFKRGAFWFDYTLPAKS